MVGYVDLVANVIAVKSNIQQAVLYFFGRNQLPYYLDHLVGHKNAPWLKANKNSICQIDVIFQYLVTKPPDYYGQLLFIQDRLQEKNFDKSKRKRGNEELKMKN